MTRTVSIRPSEVNRQWYLIDASNLILGHLATEIAHRLRGKHKPQYTPHVDTGDYIVVVNARHVSVTGRKLKQKMYHRHSGYPGGLKTISLGHLLEKKPEEVIRLAVKGMLPRSRLGRSMAKKLLIYPDREHPHTAQNPQLLSLPGVAAGASA